MMPSFTPVPPTATNIVTPMPTSTMDPICLEPPTYMDDVDPVVEDWTQLTLTQGECYVVLPKLSFTIPAFLGLWEETGISTVGWKVCVTWVALPDMTILGQEYNTGLIFIPFLLYVVSRFWRM